jgi:hypothetical protein
MQVKRASPKTRLVSRHQKHFRVESRARGKKGRATLKAINIIIDLCGKSMTKILVYYHLSPLACTPLWGEGRGCSKIKKS